MSSHNHHNMYNNAYHDSSNMFSAIYHVLFVWKASVYKLIWQDALFFALVYAVLSFAYRNVFIHYPVSREWFELVCVYANKWGNLIPISFLTGFYVTQVVTRWWDQFMSLPWPEKVAYKLVGFVPGKDSFRKGLRLTVMRYVNLSTVLVYRLVSEKVKERFPTYESLIAENLILPHEVKRLIRSDNLVPFETPCTPMLWAVKLLQRARSDGHIHMEAPLFAALLGSFDEIQERNRKMLNYGWMSFPLAYTQVATISILVYFMAALFGRQYLVPYHDDEGEGGMGMGDHLSILSHNRDLLLFPHINMTLSTSAPFNAHTPDFYVPYFTFVEILCYMGWIKVADALLNSFGDDDQDFQVNLLIDKNLAVSNMLVDQAEEELEIEDPFTEAGIFFADKINRKITKIPTVSVSPQPSTLPTTTTTTAKGETSILDKLGQALIGRRVRTDHYEEVNMTSVTESVDFTEEESDEYGEGSRSGSIQEERMWIDK